MRLINFSTANCKNCYKCVRTCPVKAIKYSNNQAEIDEERCIACGQCFVVCPQHARNIKSDLALVTDAIHSGKKVVACIAPSFAAFFENTGGFVAGLKKIGFHSVYEIASGADRVSEDYKNYIQHEMPHYAISSCCPTINLYIRRYFPELTKFLLPSLSPMLASGKTAKLHDPNAFTVFIGPCLSKKCEASSLGNEDLINAVITFDEIVDCFEMFDMNINQMVPQVPEVTSKPLGRKYPISGGISAGLSDVISKYNYDLIHVEGINNIKLLLEALKAGQLDKTYIEMSACVESCIAGPCIPKKSDNLFVRKQRVKQFIKTGWTSEHIDSTYVGLMTSFYPNPLPMRQPSETEIQSVLLKMGKISKLDELDCGSCGYNSCHEKAIAVIEGMSEVEMCMPYMRTRAEHMTDIIFINSPNLILLLDQHLNILQINPTAEKTLGIQSELVKGDPIHLYLDNVDFMAALESKHSKLNHKSHYALYNLDVIQNIIYLQKDHQLLLILSDVSEEEKRKKELAQIKINTLEIAQKVIDKQMRVAQEIASLLGETTAETKVTLNKLKNLV